MMMRRASIKLFLMQDVQACNISQHSIHGQVLMKRKKPCMNKVLKSPRNALFHLVVFDWSIMQLKLSQVA